MILSSHIIRKKSYSLQGFTLIELSIVLVIIGLIVGGVLVGRDLINAAARRSQIKQIQEYQTAVNTFYGAYNCLPGDCSNATSFFGTSGPNGLAINNGNGDGEIDTYDGQYYDNGASIWSGSTEMWGAFQQLSLAKMIPFSPSIITSGNVGKSLPAIDLNNSAGFFFGASYNYNTAPSGRNPNLSAYQNGTNAMWFVACRNLTADTLHSWDNSCAIFKAADLLAIDSKMDDGLPLTGKFYGFGSDAAPNDCLNINGAASTYKTTTASPQCLAAYVIN